MARTKQSARQSTGGKAPRSQFVAARNGATAFRHFMTTQQAAGHGDAKASFVNHENTFGSFRFYPSKQNSSAFQPEFSAASCLNPLTGIREEWIGLSCTSKFDGDGINEHPQPHLNVMIVLDVSGSMSSSLPGDVDDSDRSQYCRGSGESKLQAGKACIASILEQLKPDDHVGIAVFNHAFNPIQGMKQCDSQVRKACARRVETLKSAGGTNLAQALKEGCKHLCASDGSKRHGVVNRVVFITDMESSSADEQAVMQHASSFAASEHAVGLSVIGLGVDLSVATVQQLSAIKACRYGSANSSREMQSVIAKAFPYDRVPVATDISIALSPPFRVHRLLGSPEAGAVSQGATEVKLSCEFATPVEDDGGAYGNMLLIQLEREPAAVGAAVAQVEIKATWAGGYRGAEGGTCTETRPLKPLHAENGKGRRKASPRGGSGRGGGEGAEEHFFESLSVRKALALSRYVDAQADYAVNDVGGGAQAHNATVQRFRTLRDHVMTELAECGDDSLASANRNVIETIDHIIKLEEDETVRALQAESAPTDARASSSPGVTCPITLEVMRDPVCTADGHTYEREAIVRWLADKGTSPATGLPLSDHTLVPNHALRAMAEAARSAAVGGGASPGASSSSIVATGGRVPLQARQPPAAAPRSSARRVAAPSIKKKAGGSKAAPAKRQTSVRRGGTSVTTVKTNATKEAARKEGSGGAGKRKAEEGGSVAERLRQRKRS